jgi:regulator of protease activity HflC (stomatin/prohibitin superfamily)
MNSLFLLLEDVSSVTSESSSSSGSGSTEKLTESLKNIVKSPIFYIVIGAIVLLIILLYLLRRIIKPVPGVTKVVTRHGKIHKLIDEKSNTYFLKPFIETVGANISLREQEFTSDRLFINDGPDALYKINYTLRYQVSDVEKYFRSMNGFKDKSIIKINDELREYADDGHASDIVKDYRSREQDLLKLINKALEESGVNAVAFKINFIEPMGNK